MQNWYGLCTKIIHEIYYNGLKEKYLQLSGSPDKALRDGRFFVVVGGVNIDEYFVKVYTMKDGTEREPSTVYKTYGQAVEALNDFNPDGEGVDGFENVSFVRVEK